VWGGPGCKRLKSGAKAKGHGGEGGAGGGGGTGGGLHGETEFFLKNLAKKDR